jgi:hypothetical protein
VRSSALFIALVLPVAASLPAWAQSNDAGYCAALANKYNRYVGARTPAGALSAMPGSRQRSTQ